MRSASRTLRSHLRFVLGNAAFFCASPYDGYVGQHGREEDALGGYAYFTRCHHKGLEYLRAAKERLFGTAHPLLR